jgi:hypothetical protein
VNHIMGIVDKARTLEARISRALNRAAEYGVGPTPLEPLEIAHAIVEAVARRVEPGSRGTRLFPFNHVGVTVAAPSRESRVRYDALFAANPSLRDRIVGRLDALGCDVPDLRVDVNYAGKPARGWDNARFHVAFDRIALEPAAPSAGEARPAGIELTIVRGTAERRTYSFAIERIDFGRGAEVRDSGQRLLRSNHVVFVEGSAGVNATVSRCHAHIAVDRASGAHRVHDDRSAQGTGIVRGGRTIAVPPGSRGVRLRSGDEIVLGEARVRVRLDHRSV